MASSAHPSEELRKLAQQVTGDVEAAERLLEVMRTGSDPHAQPRSAAQESPAVVGKGSPPPPLERLPLELLNSTRHREPNSTQIQNTFFCMGILLTHYLPSLDVPEVERAARIWWSRQAALFTDASGNLVHNWQDLDVGRIPHSVAVFFDEVGGDEGGCESFAQQPRHHIHHPEAPVQYAPEVATAAELLDWD
eukprot:TRINITY_DN17741_c0_g1_i1.p2 TRINITY_DN17741_c0_g1~~TRINITY_DN17741_c0_g1_i1.p2  ORF type:complete len:193 (+),score=60.81 TRINITY_DN17741_c0_g1_i1:183-761(+)